MYAAYPPRHQHGIGVKARDKDTIFLPENESFGTIKSMAFSEFIFHSFPIPAHADKNYV